MGAWQGRLSDSHYATDDYSSALRRQSINATKEMAKRLGVVSPKSREADLQEKLEETRSELAAARCKIEWMQNNTLQETRMDVNSSERARYMLRYIAKMKAIKIEEILSDRRFREFVEARQILMWEMYKHLTWSLPRVGRFLGRDHSTVLYGKRRVDEEIKKNRYTPIEWPWMEGNDES